jgi:dipeptidyl aminopeptidase/acylaminoacyl peptidase
MEEIMRAIVVLFAVLASAAFAADPFTLEDFLTVPTLGSVAVSPDGRQVAYVKTTRDLDKDESLKELWVADVKTGAARQVSFENAGCGLVAWRGDGALSFVRKSGDKAQVWVNPLDGSEPRPVTDFAEGIDGYWWSPDGAWLAVLAPAEADTSKKKDDDADWTVYDRLEQPAEYPQLWLVPAGRWGRPDDDRVARRLSTPPNHVYFANWSPDGKTLAVTYNPRFSSLVDEDQRVAVVDVASGTWRDLSEPDRHASYAVFAPDGRRVAYFRDREAELRAYVNMKDLVVQDLASGVVTVVTPGHTMALGGFAGVPEEAPTWLPDGNALVVSGAARTTLDLYRADVRKQTLTPLTRLKGNAGSWDLAGGTLAYLESARNLPGTLYARPVGSDKPRPLATTNDAVARFALAPAQKLELPGADGTPIEGFLYLPPGKQAGDKLPGIVEMHGGPYSRYGDAWSSRYPWLVLAQEGFAVFIVNPRGGTGYGQDYLRGVYRNFGTDDYLDIMAATDTLVARGIVDADRLGFTGYSYGGLMTDVVVSRTDRFRAAVSIAGIFNFVSAMGQSNPQLFIDSYREPWAGDLPRLWEHSPASRADRIKTPMLVMHGQDDKPVDPRQSVELFSYLQLNGVPSRLVLYPGEGHGINKPSHVLDYQTREIQWFRHYLLDDPQAVGGDQPVPVEPRKQGG